MDPKVAQMGPKVRKKASEVAKMCVRGCPMTPRAHQKVPKIWKMPYGKRPIEIGLSLKVGEFKQPCFLHNSGAPEPSVPKGVP